jgi:hypothetical protein
MEWFTKIELNIYFQFQVFEAALKPTEVPFKISFNDIQSTKTIAPCLDGYNLYGDMCYMVGIKV